MARVLIKRGKARPFWYRHPWVFSGAVERVVGPVRDGDVVQIYDQEGRFIGQGFYNSRSQIRVRILTHDPDDRIDADFFRRRLERAIELRERILRLPEGETDAYRLVHGEGDGLSGLVVDRYGSHLVVQFAALGIKQRERLFLDYLAERLRPASIFENSRFPYRDMEGAARESAFRYGEAPTGWITVRENGLLFQVDLLRGQKMGLYCDHRDSRTLLARYAPGRRVLDCFTYTGAFALYCARAGAAEVLAVDTPSRALVMAEENARRNGLEVTFRGVDVDRFLGELHHRRERFDLVILDPPRFAVAKKDVDAAVRRYLTLNAAALRVVSGGGLLATASCFYHVSEELFEATLNEAAKRAGRFVQILHRTGQAPDFPVCTACRESRYLTFILARVS